MCPAWKIAATLVGVVNNLRLVLGDGGHGVAVDVGAGGRSQPVPVDVEHGAAVRQRVPATTSTLQQPQR